MADKPEKGTAVRKKTGFFRGVKQEWQKIIWTDRKTLVKQAALVILISVVMGVLITVVDSGALQLLKLIMG